MKNNELSLFEFNEKDNINKFIRTSVKHTHHEVWV